MISVEVTRDFLFGQRYGFKSTNSRFKSRTLNALYCCNWTSECLGSETLILSVATTLLLPSFALGRYLAARYGGQVAQIKLSILAPALL